MNNNTMILQGFKPVNTLELSELEKITRENLKFRDIVYGFVYDSLVDSLQNDYLYNAPFRYEYGCIYCTRVNLDNRYGYGVKWSDLIDYLETCERDFAFLEYYGYKKSPLELAKQAEILQDKLDDHECGYIELSYINHARILNKITENQHTIEEIIERSIDIVLDSADDIDYLVYELDYLREFAFDDLYIDNAGNIQRVTITKVA